MNLSEYQKLYGIKRIDFDKVHRTDIDEEYGDDKLICPYCKHEFEYESEDTGDILNGTSWQCPECEKWFYAEGEASITVTCTPMEDAVIDHKRHIERSYEHIDQCEEAGMKFPKQRYGFVEWEVYQEFAYPLFENEEMEEKAGSLFENEEMKEEQANEADD